MARLRVYRIQTYAGEVLAERIAAPSKREALVAYANWIGDTTSLSRLMIQSKGVGSDPEYSVPNKGLAIAKEV